MKAFVRLGIVLGIATLIAFALYWGADRGWGKLASVHLEMDPASDQATLFGHIEGSLQKSLKKFEGSWLWDVPLEEILKKVEADKRVRSAKVTRVFPNRLEVTIEPHQPAVAWVDEVGRFYPIATDATLLPALSSQDMADIPLLRGRAFKDDEELRAKALALLNELPSTGALTKKRVAEITYGPRDGFTLLLTQGAIEVRLGEGDIGLKASRADRVINYLQDQQLRGRVIDARFAKKVVVRLRNDP